MYCFILVKCYNIIMKEKFVLIVAVAMLLCLIGSILAIALQNKQKLQVQNLGVWWWDNRIDDSYLDFAEDNGVTEIYYYVSTFNDKVANFISKANAKDIKVYWLTGKYEWIEDNSQLIQKMDDFLSFQSTHPNAFAGVHFDIEPHQHPQFEERRQELLTKFIDLTYNLKSTYNNVFIEYDIPCWLNDEIFYNGTTKPAYAHIIDNANRVTLMSYRDNAQAIYDFAKDELIYAQSINKPLNLGVETQDVNENIVTFFEEGKNYMYNQLNNLKTMIPKNYGLCIHHIVSWKELKS